GRRDLRDARTLREPGLRGTSGGAALGDPDAEQTRAQHGHGRGGQGRRHQELAAARLYRRGGKGEAHADSFAASLRSSSGSGDSTTVSRRFSAGAGGGTPP